MKLLTLRELVNELLLQKSALARLATTANLARSVNMGAFAVTRVLDL